VNISDFEKIVRVATERKLLLQVGYMWRYHPGVEKALEAARNGWLGELYLLKGTIGNQLDLRRREEWGEFAGGVLYELGGHVIDPIVRLMGKPLKVTPFLRTDGASKDKLRDNTAAVFEWKGALGIVQCTTLQPGSSRRHQVGKDAFQRLIGGGNLHEADVVLAGQPRQHLTEPAEVVGLDLDTALRTQSRSADRRVG